MSTATPRTTTLRAVAARWTEPDYGPRAEAVMKTLAADNRFTAESIAFSVNHATDLLAGDAIASWLGEIDAPRSTRLGIISRGQTPTEGFLEAATATLAGFDLFLVPGQSSPALLAAFFEEAATALDDSFLRVGTESELFADAGAVLALGNAHDRENWICQAEKHGIPASRMMLREQRAGVAIITGTETRAELSGLAEDILLHEGGTPQSVRLLFAPEDLQPDAVLEAMAGFREVFPPHPTTEGSFKMLAAFLEAAKQSHAVGPGFLVSKGDPEVQSGSHLRWVTYSEADEPVQWIGSHQETVAYVAAAAPLADELAQDRTLQSTPILSFGDAHRPMPGQPPLTDELREFLRQRAS